MPKNGYITITAKDEDGERLLKAAADLLGTSPIKAEDLSPAEQLRLLLDRHEKLQQNGVNAAHS